MRSRLPSMTMMVLLLCQCQALSLALAPLRSVTPRRIVATQQARGGAVVMIEAFDLMPVMDCLKNDDMDVVQACMDSLSPWLEITEEGDFNISPNAINGFIGGSVGVIGTVLSTMMKKSEVKDRLKCTYCAGSGQIVCGWCLGIGVTGELDAQGKLQSVECSNCERTGTVVCINCQGSGLNVPDEFLSVLGDAEVGFTEEDYIGLFDETPIPKSAPPTVAATSLAKASAAPPGPKAPVEAAVGERPEDFLGSG